MTLPDQIYLLTKAIRQKGEEEAEKILSQARTQAQQMVKGATEAGKRKLEHARHQEESRANIEAKRIMDSAEIKARRKIMKAREEVINRLTDQARQRLLEMRGEPIYALFVKNALLQALEALPGKEASVKVRDGEREVLSAIIKEAEEKSGKEIKLLPEAADIEGGCLVYGPGLRIMVDCSLEAVMERWMPRLKEMASRELSELTYDQP